MNRQKQASLKTTNQKKILQTIFQKKNNLKKEKTTEIDYT